MVLVGCSHLGSDEGGAKQILFKLMQWAKRPLHRSEFNSKCNLKKNSWIFIVKSSRRGLLWIEIPKNSIRYPE